MLRKFALALTFVIAIGLSESSILTIYTWRSYIRSPAELLETFKSDVKGMEALVDLTPDGQPIIGEGKTSSFLVEEFIDQTIDYHNNLENEMPTKYVVFYFYETSNITVVQKTVDILKRKENEINFPIWLRAALAMGVDRCNIYTVFSDAIGFTEQVKKLDNVVLGVRWTTWKVDEIAQGIYSKAITDKMFEMLKRAGVFEMKRQAINFFIRGHYVHRSLEHLKELWENVNKTNPVTFTIYTDEQYWFGENLISKPLFPENITALREAITFLGPENVYLQVSDEIRADLDLRELSNKLSTTTKSAAMLNRMNFISLVPFISVTFIGIFVFH